MAAIGVVNKYILKLTDANQEPKDTTLSNKFAFNAEATYNQVDTASRALATLTKYSYQDTILVTNVSVNEVLAG